MGVKVPDRLTKCFSTGVSQFPFCYYYILFIQLVTNAPSNCEFTILVEEEEEKMTK